MTDQTQPPAVAPSPNVMPDPAQPVPGRQRKWPLAYGILVAAGAALMLGALALAGFWAAYH